jgi:hypothetical protein
LKDACPAETFAVIGTAFSLTQKEANSI